LGGLRKCDADQHVVERALSESSSIQNRENQIP
jgi:hypothetical protein